MILSITKLYQVALSNITKLYQVVLININPNYIKLYQCHQQYFYTGSPLVARVQILLSQGLTTVCGYILYTGPIWYGC